MIKSTIFLIFILIYSLISADDIKLKSGNIFQNVQVVDSTESNIIIRTTFGIKKVPKNIISKIIKKPYNPNIESEYVDVPFNDSNSFQDKVNSYNTTESYLKVKPIFLLYSALSFLISWDYLKEANDINKTIKNFNKLSDIIQNNEEIDTSHLESQRNRKRIIGIAFLIGGVVNIFEAFEKVHVSTNSKEISLKYSF